MTGKRGDLPTALDARHVWHPFTQAEGASEAIAIVAGLCTSYFGYLFDGYVVQGFPFVGQFTNALDVIKGGFTTIP